MTFTNVNYIYIEGGRAELSSTLTTLIIEPTYVLQLKYYIKILENI